MVSINCKESRPKTTYLKSKEIKISDLLFECLPDYLDNDARCNYSCSYNNQCIALIKFLERH
jgi:hypothetical protein